MSLTVDSNLILLATFGVGLFAGLALERWAERRSRLKAQLAAALQAQVEALTRAKEASELANGELKQALDQLEQAAGTDRLTGAWNRRRFDDGAIQLMALSSRRGDALSLILLDLDHFKRINDTFGHGVGDLVLKSVTSTVQEQLRASDVLARWGGEEFVVLCPATTLAGATILAEKIRKAVEARPIPQAGMVTISLGVATHHPSLALDAWVTRADEALYRAKERGRNRTETSLEAAGPGGMEPALLELVWDPALESGNAGIDHQHQQIYRIANNLLASITSGRYPEDAKLQMQLLLAHVAQHFHDEEAILARINHADLKAHAAEHARLLAKAKGLQEQMGGVMTDLPAILSFLAIDLVKGHILTWDRRFFPHVAQA